MRRIAFAFLLLITLALAVRNDRWRIIGPGGGGAQFIPSISPHNPQHVLVACDMTGSYLTTDGGANWRMFNLRGVSRFFEWDPNRPSVIYAGTNGLYRSEDAGKTWRLIYPDPRQVTGTSMSNDHADEAFLVNGKPVDRIVSLAIDSADSNRLYAAAGRALKFSTDGGVSWRTEREFATPVRRVWIAQNIVYAALERSVARKEQNQWTEGAPLPARWIDIAAGPPVIYAVWESGAAVSEDGGATWRNFELQAGATPRLHAVATSRLHPGSAFVSYSRLSMNGTNWFGVARTVDRGRSWKLVWRESSVPSSNVHDAWITARFGPGWSGHPLSLGVSPNDPKLCYATTLGSTVRTSDGGDTWESVYSRRTAQGWTSTGLDVTTSYGVHFDPFDKGRMFITYTDIGLSRSEDGGRSWVPSTEGVPRPWVNTTYWMVFDPDVRGRVWAVASGTHDLPRPKMWRHTSVSEFRGGVIRSDDGGRTWRRTTEGMPETAATYILLDPKSPKESRVLYVTGFGRGVYKSVDGGASWSLKNRGLEGDEPFAWRLSINPGGGLYLVVARRGEDGNIGNTQDGALYCSSDGAEHWKKLPLPEGVNGPNGVAISPNDPKRLYLAAWGRNRVSAGTGGIFLSADGGVNWRNVLSQDQHVYDITVDPRDPATLYACGFESAAWRSSDAGETWKRVKGYNFKWGHRVIPDPSDPAAIYITTFGGSVWHGPAGGDPEAVEDIAGNNRVGR